MRSQATSWRIITTFLLAIALVTMGGLASVSAQNETDDPEMVDAGMAIFETNCAGCHGLNGEGSDRGRPLTGIAEQEPDRSVHLLSVENGKGTGMPAFGDRLDDEEIDAAVSFVRLTFIAQPEPELAVTGYNSVGLAMIGTVLAVGGATLVLFTRRRQAL